MTDSRPLLSTAARVLLRPNAQLWIRRVPLHEILIPDNHCGGDVAHVAELVGLYRAGFDAPPAFLAADATIGRCWLIEGRHRYAGAILAGRPDLLATVTALTDLVLHPVDVENDARPVYS